MNINWENFREGAQGPLDLLGVFEEVRPGHAGGVKLSAARNFLINVEDLSPIHSRQAAAIAIAHALGMLE